MFVCLFGRLTEGGVRYSTIRKTATRRRAAVVTGACLANIIIAVFVLSCLYFHYAFRVCRGDRFNEFCCVLPPPSELQQQ